MAPANIGNFLSTVAPRSRELILCCLTLSQTLVALTEKGVVDETSPSVSMKVSVRRSLLSLPKLISVHKTERAGTGTCHEV